MFRHKSSSGDKLNYFKIMARDYKLKILLLCLYNIMYAIYVIRT